MAVLVRQSDFDYKDGILQSDTRMVEPPISIHQEEQIVSTEPEQVKNDVPVNAETPAPENARVQVRIDDSKVNASYANFCRVTGTPEELIVDFGVNPQPMGVPTEPIPVTQRIITNYYTAKRMLHALQMSIQRHEATFGVLETDVQKRVQPGVLAQAQQRQQQPTEK